jgi:hypothetical protein
VPRSYRDRREIAVQAASRLMAKYPHSVVALEDLQSGKGVAVKFDLRGRADAAHHAPDGVGDPSTPAAS